MAMSPPGPVEIRKSATIYAIGTVLVGGFALWMGAMLAYAAAQGRPSAAEPTSWLVFLGTAVIAGWSLWNALDRRVVIRLTADGFHDLREENGLLPWSEVRSAAIGQSDTVLLQLKHGRSDRLVHVRALDMSGRAIIDYARRAAPRVDENVVDLLDFVRDRKGE
jgi:hypothetical protein